MEPKTEPWGTLAKKFFPGRSLSIQYNLFLQSPGNLSIISMSHHLFYVISSRILNLSLRDNSFIPLFKMMISQLKR